METNVRDFDITTGNTLDKIRKAALLRTILKISYTDSKGVPSFREVEPYEIKDGKLYAHCLTANSIRAFKLMSIAQAQVTDRAFEPRFPVKIE